MNEEQPKKEYIYISQGRTEAFDSKINYWAKKGYELVQTFSSSHGNNYNAIMRLKQEVSIYKSWEE